MKILIVEDNPLQGDWMVNTLSQRIPNASIQQCNTEYEFRSAFETIAADPPNLVLMDVMLKWTDPSPDMVRPPETIAAAGHRRAGIRCQKMLQDNPLTKHIPVILYTALAASSLKADLKDLPSEVKYLAKESNADALVREIQKVLLKTT